VPLLEFRSLGLLLELRFESCLEFPLKFGYPNPIHEAAVITRANHGNKACIPVSRSGVNRRGGLSYAPDGGILASLFGLSGACLVDDLKLGPGTTINGGGLVTSLGVSGNLSVCLLGCSIDLLDV